MSVSIDLIIAKLRNAESRERWLRKIIEGEREDTFALIRKHLGRGPLGVRAFAAEIGTSPQSVSRWFAGQSRPREREVIHQAIVRWLEARDSDEPHPLAMSVLRTLDDASLREVLLWSGIVAAPRTPNRKNQT